MPVQLQWGLNNEENATLKCKDQVENKENVVIKSCGLVVSPKWPWLGCSPDGVLLQCEECIGCLEIKCPYLKKDMTVVIEGHLTTGSDVTTLRAPEVTS